LNGCKNLIEHCTIIVLYCMTIILFLDCKRIDWRYIFNFTTIPLICTNSVRGFLYAHTNIKHSNIIMRAQRQFFPHVGPIVSLLVQMEARWIEIAQANGYCLRQCGGGELGGIKIAVGTLLIYSSVMSWFLALSRERRLLPINEKLQIRLVP